MDEITLKYVGNGKFLPGVPARDLSDNEVEEFGGEKRLLESGLYIRTKKPQPQANKMALPESENKAKGD